MLRVGNPNIREVSKATQFKTSGNPRGRRKDVHNVAALSRTFTEEATLTLAEIMRDKEQPAGARVNAAVALLNRGWGMPMQAMDVRLHADIRVLSDVELLQLIADQRSERAIDVTGSDRAGALPAPAGPPKPNGTGSPPRL
jgi:hypothetical protein